MPNADKDAIYCRWSGHKKGKEESIESQLAKCRALVALDGRECLEYLDQAESGAYARRPGLDALIEDAYAHRFRRVIITHPDRVSRGDGWERPLFERQMRDAGVEIIYIDYKKADTPEGEMADDVMSAFAKYERKRIKQRMDDARAQKVADGHPWRGADPYGWHYVRPEGKKAHGRFVIVPEQSAIVAEIYSRCVAGASGYAIAEELNRRGVPAADGGRWSRVSIHKVLHNPIHMGKIASNRYYAVKPSNPKNIYTAQKARSTRERPREEWQFVDLDDRVVTPEVWEHAQTCLANNKKFSRRNSKRSYLLAGMLICGQPMDGQPWGICGRKLYGTTTSKGTPYYRCNRNPSSDATVTCSCKGRIDAASAEDRVWMYIAGMLTRPEALALQYLADGAITLAQRDRIVKDLANAEQRHVTHQRSLDALLRKNLAGQIDDLTYARVQGELVEARDSAKREIAYLQQETARLSQQQISIEGLKVYAEAARADMAALRTADDATALAIKQKHIRTLIQRVVAFPDGNVSLTCAVPTLRPDQLATMANDPAHVTVNPAAGCCSQNPHFEPQPAALNFTVMLAA